jgi:multidrug efflux pump subunit AcrA (membrane-fusion protein)
VDDHPTIRTHTETIQLSTVPDQFQAPGTVRARLSTTLSSKIVGQILSIAVREGDRVRKGQIIARIDNREAATQLRRAQAGVAEVQRSSDEIDKSIQGAEVGVRLAQANQDLAASTLKRYELLRERRSVSPQEYDEVETRYKAAVLETSRASEMLAAANARRLQIDAHIQQAEADVQTSEVRSKCAALTDRRPYSASRSRCTNLRGCCGIFNDRCPDRWHCDRSSG